MEMEIVGDRSLPSPPGADWPGGGRGAGGRIETLVAVELDAEETTVAIVRRLLAGGDVVGQAVPWSRHFADPAEARLCFEWLSGRADDIVLWSAASSVLGEGWVDRIVASGIRDHAVAVAAEEARAASRRAAEEKAEMKARRKAEEISVYFKDHKGRARLTMQRGSDSTPFWSIDFDQKWERERFWDWLKWQRRRFGDFARMAGEGTRLELESKLLHEMLTTEKAAKAEGLTISGQRPLRFWPGQQ